MKCLTLQGRSGKELEAAASELRWELEAAPKKFRYLCFFFCFPRGFELISMWIHARKHSRLVGSGPKGFKKQRTAVEKVDSRRNFEGMFGTHVGIHQTVIKVFRDLFLFFICFLLLR